jgi:hypothetical protein
MEDKLQTFGGSMCVQSGERRSRGGYIQTVARQTRFAAAVPN